MKIERIELREIRLPLVAPFETSLGRTTDRRIILVRVFNNGISGWGECTVGEGPFYNHEATGTAWIMIRDFVGPLVVGKQISSAAECAALTRHIRGNRKARGAVETAVWDLEARQKNLPLWKLLGGTRKEISCGVSIGIQENCSTLLKKIEKEIAAGYQRIKIKIKPGWDCNIVRAVRAEFPDITLSVDANSAYTLADTKLLKALDAYNLLMIEQPLAHDDLLDHAELQRQLQTAICLDESILHVDSARQALAIGACRIINIKLGRVSGHSEARRVHDYCYERDVPVWCGGMLEAGIGRAHNIAMSTRAGFSLPGDVSASKRYWTEDIVAPPVEVTPRGTIIAPQAAGIGFEIDEARINALTARTEVIK